MISEVCGPSLLSAGLSLEHESIMITSSAIALPRCQLSNYTPNHSFNRGSHSVLTDIVALNKIQQLRIWLCPPVISVSEDTVYSGKI